MDQVRRRSPMFKCGDAVEVCFLEDGLRGAWFEARVTGVQRRRDRPTLYRYRVVFESLEDEKGVPLRIHVPASRVRPRPPLPDAGAGLVVGGCVDALWRDAWWSGVITHVPPEPAEGEEEEGKYSLYFEATEEQMDFMASELRPHLNWIDGNWVAPAIQDNLANPKIPRGTMFVDRKERLHAPDPISGSNDHPLPEILSISGHSIDFPSAESSDVSKENSAFKVKRKSPYQQKQDLSNSKKKLKDKVPVDSSLLLDIITINDENIAEKVEKDFDNTTQTVGRSPHLKPCLVNKSSTSKSPLKDVDKQTQESNMMDHIVLLEQENNDVVPSNSNGGSLCQDSNILLSGTSNAEGCIESECLKYENQNNLINNHCSLGKMDCPQGARIADSASKFQEGSFADSNSLMPHTGDKSNRKDKNPLTHEKLMQEPPQNLIQEREIHVDTYMKEMIVEGKVDKECEPSNEQIAPPHQTESCCEALVLPMSISANKLSGQGGDRLCSMYQSNALDQNNSSSLTASEVETFSDTTMLPSNATLLGVSISNCQDNKTRRVTVAEVPSNTSHQAESDPTVEISMPETRGLNLDKCSAFVKSFPLWPVIHSMEVFSKFPQCPHFRPLEEQPETCREGMAIGLIMTFSTAIEKVKNLAISDSGGTLEYSLKTLVQLQEHGFDAQHVVGLIEKLLSLKGSRDQLLSKGGEAQNLFYTKQIEVERLNVEEKLIDKSISDLLKSLSLLHEKKDTIVQQQEACNSEMKKLESSAKEIKDKLVVMESKFEAAINSAF